VIATVSTTTANPIFADHGYTGCTYTPSDVAVTIDPDGNNAVPETGTLSFSVPEDKKSDVWFIYQSASVNGGDRAEVYGDPQLMEIEIGFFPLNFNYEQFFKGFVVIERGIDPRDGDVIVVTQGFNRGAPPGYVIDPMPGDFNFDETNYRETICQLRITYTVAGTPPPPAGPPPPPAGPPPPPAGPDGRCWDSLKIWMSCRTPAALPQTV
jgi:hypothetical protein